MATVTFNVPDDVQRAFDSAFTGERRNAVIAALMREVLAQSQPAPAASESFRARVLRRTARGASYSDDDIRALRQEGRS